MVTEAGFGADLGAEKFLDIKCPRAKIAPNAIVIVATTKAIKYNGGVSKDQVKEPNMNAIKDGIENLQHHISTMKNYGAPVVVAINKYDTDVQEEIDYISEHCGCPVAVCTAHAEGGKGAMTLAQLVLDNIKDNVNLIHPYSLCSDDLDMKMTHLAQHVYGAKEVKYSNEALINMRKFERMGFGFLPICVAKTQYSISDNPKLLGEPENFAIYVRDFVLNSGAGFIVAVCGTIMRMPGLPKIPAAENIDVVDGKIVGLF